MKHSRFGKSTHISMISDSVTDLRSYDNSAIAGNSTRALICRCLHIESRYCHIEWRVFCYVSQCFKSVSYFTTGSRCFRRLTMYHVLQVFHDVLLCFTMFSESCNVRRLHGRRSPQGSRQCRRDRK